MVKFRVKNFGPITDGFTDDAFLNITKLTVFIGNQGTGKSTAAKLFSSFSWIEKTLFKKQISASSIFTKSYVTKLFKFHKIDTFLKTNTEIEYIGDYLHILYKDNVLSTQETNGHSYILPKIQYIPAERNLVSVVDKYAQISYLPESLQDFMLVYDIAVQSNATQNVTLPINELKIRYNNRTHKVELFNADYTVLLSEASSGLQSFVPFFVVQKFLTHELFSSPQITFKNLNERQKVSAAFEKERGYTTSSDADLLAYAEKNKTTLFNSCLISILEEPEQNLFPFSQKNIIFDLLANLSVSDSNKLLLTTHSPYFLPYINSVLKATEIANAKPASRKKIEEIIPSRCFIDAGAVHVYEFADGKITALKKHRNISSDDNLLNHELVETNELYRQILKAGA